MKIWASVKNLLLDIHQLPKNQIIYQLFLEKDAADNLFFKIFCRGKSNIFLVNRHKNMLDEKNSLLIVLRYK
ncbi:MAG TPA: hypothetical protein DCO75_06735 [Fibrobacteres bacterium]|nr:hypothetical protein [Fibrobacterota bacterium]